MSRYRSFVFTHNGYSEADISRYQDMEAKYIVVARERGASGNEHLQGYIEFDSACTIKAAIKKLQPAHVELRKGTPQQASDYCKKGEQSHEEWESLGTKGPNFGKNLRLVTESGFLGPGQGARSDLEKVVDRVKEGAKSSAIAAEFPIQFLKFHRGISALIRARMAPRNPENPPYVEWRWGLAGRGKTSHVMKTHREVYIKDSTKWWQGYTQQEAILVDDFDGQWPFRNLLRFLDVNPYQGEVKGEDSVDINSPYIYITCEFPPEHFWQGNDLEQLTSRLTKVVEVTGPNYRLLKKARVEEVESKKD